MNQSKFTKMSIKELKVYIKEQKPIKDKKMKKAYSASDVWGFQELSEEACEPIWRAGMQLRKIQTKFKMEKHDCGDLMTFEGFKEDCEHGCFIDNDGSGNYATATEESDINIRPSDIEEGVYREDFTHIMWYNK